MLGILRMVSSYIRKNDKTGCVGGSMKDKELEVLQQYDIDVKGTRKVRGAFFCDTNKGPFLLQEVKCSEKRIPVLYELQNHLLQEGYKNVDIFIKNKEGSLISVTEDEERFTLKRWFYGKECDNKREIDIMEGVRNLALLHRILKKEFETPLSPKEDISQEFVRHNREMKKVRSFIRNKVGKGEFEVLYLKYFEAMYEWAVSACGRLESTGYKMLLKKSGEEATLVHGDYNYHNILMTQQGMVTTNFDHFYRGIQVTDFYYFLRKTMEKNQWNVELGNKMLENYDRIHPLSKDEWEYIAVCIMYPEKFWKAANSYFRSSKAWLPAKSLEKLQLAIKQTEQKKHFLEEIFSIKS